MPDTNTPDGSTQQAVTGVVTQHDGTPAADVPVTATARRLRSQDPLGTAVTDAHGGYRITYSPLDSPADIVVHASVNDTGSEATVQLDGTADLTLPRGEEVPEYQRVLSSVTPLLDGVAVTELGADDTRADFEHLARLTGYDNGEIRLLSVVHRLADETGLPAEAFYGLQRQGLSGKLTDLAQLPALEIETALTAAAAAGTIAAVPAEFHARLRESGVSALVNPPAGTPLEPIAGVFAVAITDPAERERAFHAYLDRTGDNARFAADDSRLELALKLGEFTDNNAELVSTLLAKFDSGELTHPRDLARLDADWTDLVAQANASDSAVDNASASASDKARHQGDPLDSIQSEGSDNSGDSGYAEIIRNRIIKAYPTAHVAHRLSILPDQAEAPSTQFLTSNPEFDITTTPVNTATVPDESARAELAGIQRTWKITSRFEAMQALRDNGLTSSQAVAGMARDVFAARVADVMDEDEANAVHTRASQVHAAAINLVTDLRTQNHFASVPWLAAAEPLTAQVPDWEELFGSADYLTGPESVTVYSEAAYFVELMLYVLRLGVLPKLEPPIQIPINWETDPLYVRRRDLWDIDLNAGNTELTLPYIDIVNEVLESAVAPHSAIDPKLRQTTGDATQLRVQPQHVNSGAYTLVNGAPYPWNLTTFDLWREQINTYLGHLGVQRTDLLDVLGEPDSRVLVREQLGLTPLADSIIAGEFATTPSIIGSFYGRDVTTLDELLNDLRGVRKLLDAAELRYTDLLSLLDTRFINPGKTLVVKADPDLPADTTKMTIPALDAGALDRLHRFVRLQRVLGWTPQQLDRVIAACGTGGDLNLSALRCIAGFRALADLLNVEVDDVLCFYGPLDTHFYRTEPTPPRYDRLFLDPTVVVPQPGVVNPFALNDARTELRAPADPTHPTVTAALLAVLEVTDEELTALIRGPHAVVGPGGLTLASLSALMRTVTLARGLDIKTIELLRLMAFAGDRGPFPLAPGQAFAAEESELAGGAPLASDTVDLPRGRETELAGGGAIQVPAPPLPDAVLAPVDLLIAATKRFVTVTRSLTMAGVGLADLDAVLANTVAPRSGTIPDDNALATVLTTLRAALQAVYQQTSQTTDEKGDVTRKSLALLGWDAALVQEAASTLLGTAIYTATLAALPDGIAFPTDIPIRYQAVDSETAQLVLTGPMTKAQLTRLKALLPGNPAYLAAVQKLCDAPRVFVKTRMKALRLPIYAVGLEAWPGDVTLPPSLAGRVFYDAGRKALCARGYLTSTELELLGKASGAEKFRKAVTDLAVAQETPPAPGNSFFVAADADALFDNEVTPAARLGRVLAIVQPYLRSSLSETAVKQQLGQAAGLDAASGDLLLGTLLRAPASTKPLLTAFITPDFVSSDAAVAVTRAGFATQFEALVLLYRVALVTTRLRITAAEIPFVFTRGPVDFNQLPARPPADLADRFWTFIRLVELIELRDSVPGGVPTLQAVTDVAGATLSQVEQVLSARTGWNQADVHGLVALLKITQPAQLAGQDALRSLIAAVRLLRKLGVSADRLPQWLAATVTPEAAQAAWSAAKARHSVTDWPAVATPMQDKLRDRRRAALVSYLVAKPVRINGVPQWTDANGMHDYYLLDVEMGSYQQTSRLAAAIYSIQLFVQRCQLNLEPDIAVSKDDAIWKQWEWMRLYQLWVANYKVFLYPENYFEPDLRADASPFFKDFQNELNQSELTSANGETAVIHYLEEVNSVARLLPITSAGAEERNFDQPVDYIVARTESTPFTYYIRKWINNLYWTPWEKIDLDIQSSALAVSSGIGRVFLTWLTFKEVSHPAEITALPSTEEPIKQSDKHLNVFLNWSSYRNGQWTPKRTSSAFITSDPDVSDRDLHRPDLYVIGASNGNYEAQVGVGVLYNRSFRANLEVKAVYSGTFNLNIRSGGIEATGLAPQYYDDPGNMLEPRNPLPLATMTVNNEYVRDPGYSPSHSLWIPLRAGGDPIRYRRVLGKTIADLPPFRVHYTGSGMQPGIYYRKFFTQGPRTWRIETTDWPPNSTERYGFRFHNFYHPYTEMFLSQYTRRGLDGLYHRDQQVNPWKTFDFKSAYDPDPTVVEPIPREDVDFSPEGPYSSYNWELFFHAPLLLAQRLTTSQRFAESLQWFHRIFDPTDRSDKPAPQRYWRTKPFYEMSADPNSPDNYTKQRIEKILRRISEGDTELDTAVNMWLRNPFQPDVVAKFRTTAYQKAVVMKYLDNLIAWGDQLFRQDTMESISQATQLYVLASELLGRRPEEVPREEPAPKTFRIIIDQAQAELQGTATSAVSSAENLVPAPHAATMARPSPVIAPHLGMAWFTYFHIPRNEKLLGYWDTVADRLFKIRNGQNIDGIQRQAAAFGPPIDPALLVRAAAAGIDLGTVLDDISAPVPHYRFGTMLAKAKEFAGEVKAFGAALLSALEKRDVEQMARLRAGHETALLQAARDVREQQLADTTEALNSVSKQADAALAKKKYYSSRLFMSNREASHLERGNAALIQQEMAFSIDLGASLVSVLPDIKLGSPTTAGVTWGSSNLIAGMRGVSAAHSQRAAIMSAAGSLAATYAGYERRQDDWTFQAEQADVEAKGLAHQIEGAKIRHGVAALELNNHDKQTDQSREVDALLRGKYTGEELYDWLAGQLTTSYFQAYQLAYDVAKRAERAYRHELGADDSAFIQFGYWDSLHKGLLSGERLAADLNRLDASYHELNAREFELTKRVSLAQLDPEALLKLKQTGRCFISLPEAVFDLDTPGHYLRRIKNVAITVPCVAGPYTGVNLTATLLRSTVRTGSTLNGGKYARQPGDTRFRDYLGPIQSIVTSTGQDDSGLFETNLRDERFLPFEGAGAAGEWQLSLPDKFRQFDYESITDVVLHLRYTAREGGAVLGDQAVKELADALNKWVHSDGGRSLHRAFSARREFPDQWAKLLNPAAGGDSTMTFRISKSRFPFLFRDKVIKAANPEIVLVLSKDLAERTGESYVDSYGEAQLAVRLSTSGSNLDPVNLTADPTLDGQPSAGFDVNATVTGTDQEWTVTLPNSEIMELAAVLRTPEGRLNPDAVVDLLLVWQYTISDK